MTGQLGIILIFYLYRCFLAITITSCLIRLEGVNTPIKSK